MRWLIGFAAIGAIAYLGIVATLFLQQARFLYPAPQHVAALPPGFQDIRLTTEDGLTLRSAYRPGHDGMDIAIYFHGNGGSLTGSTAATAQLAERGFGLMLVEYRGYGGNPGEPSEQGFYSDGRAALDFLAKRGIAADRIVMIGNSMGSGVATQLASENPPKALILSAAFTSLPDVVSEKLRWLPVRLLLRDRFDNAAKIGAITAPILLQHGELDTLIPVAHGSRLADLAPAATFERYDGGMHDLVFTPEAQGAQVAWLGELR